MCDLKYLKLRPLNVSQDRSKVKVSEKAVDAAVGRGSSLAPQCRHRIEPRCPPRRQIRGNRRDDNERADGRSVRGGI
jgi:hypothetical protein